jgi:transcriptional regulator with GAF, ATPase, and Fis domain
VSGLTERFERVAEAEMQRRLSTVLDYAALRVLREGLRRSGADEGTLWIASRDRKELIPVFNSGPEPEAFLGKVRQPLDRGVISMVFHSGQPFCENEVTKNTSHDHTVDEALRQVTAAMIALPFFFGGRRRGVLSCVRLGHGEFEAQHLSELQQAASLLERLADWHLLQELLETDPA